MAPGVVVVVRRGQAEGTLSWRAEGRGRERERAWKETAYAPHDAVTALIASFVRPSISRRSSVVTVAQPHPRTGRKRPTMPASVIFVGKARWGAKEVRGGELNGEKERIDSHEVER